MSFYWFFVTGAGLEWKQCGLGGPVGRAGAGIGVREGILLWRRESCPENNNLP